MNAKDVQRIRAKLKLSQSQFARQLGVSVRTLQDWEQGRNSPGAPAIALLNLQGQSFEPYIVVLLPVMETPAILTGLMLARRGAPAAQPRELQGSRARTVVREVLLHGSVVLLLVAGFAGLIVLRGTEFSGDETAAASLAPVGPAAISRVAQPPAERADTSTNAPQGALLELAAQDRDLLTSLVPSGGTAAPVAVLSRQGAHVAANAPTAPSAPRLTRTRLRIVSEKIADQGVMIVLRGLPEGVTLSDGMSPSPGTWVLGLETSGQLHIIAPATFQGILRTSLEVLGPRGVSLLRQEADIKLPASELVLVLPSIPSQALPPATAPRGAPQQHARGGAGTVRPVADVDGGDRAAQRPTLQSGADAWAASSTTEEPVIAQPDVQPGRRTLAQPPAYGLGGPR